MPLFFVISGYLFFVKLNGDPEHDKKRLIRFVKRDMQLYLFWFIVLLPITLYQKQCFTQSMLYGILQIVKGFVFGSTFSASWYLMALVEGVLIINFLSKKLPTKALLCITGLIQIVCCLASNYRWLFAEDGLFIQIVSLYPGTIYNSFLTGLWWLTLGKYIAEKEKESNAVEIKALPVFIIIGLVALYAEQALIYRLDCSYANDVYFLLTPVVIPTFLCVKNCNMRIRHAECLRSFSTITYCTHVAFGAVYKFIVRRVFDVEMMAIVFVATLISCCILAIVINVFEKKKVFSWLRYSH
ncbi:MAG: acyltransferase family protein [Oscillospiraceae bacterium]|nr:acyltransferase family protein [Oscillospiraceae bacterium]